MIYALIAALLVLLGFALCIAWIMWRACCALAAENAGLRSAVEYRDEIIESRLGEEAIDVTCECESCREAERWLVN